MDFISIRIKLNKHYLFPTLLFNLWIRERSKASCIRGTTGKDERSDKTASIFVYEETIWKNFFCKIFYWNFYYSKTKFMYR